MKSGDAVEEKMSMEGRIRSWRCVVVSVVGSGSGKQV